MPKFTVRQFQKLKNCFELASHHSKDITFTYNDRPGNFTGVVGQQEYNTGDYSLDIVLDDLLDYLANYVSDKDVLNSNSQMLLQHQSLNNFFDLAATLQCFNATIKYDFESSNFTCYTSSNIKQECFKREGNNLTLTLTEINKLSRSQLYILTNS